MSIQEKEKEIVEEFALFEDDWEQKYTHLIDLGRSLPLISEDERSDDRLVKGCQSRVWLKARMEVRYAALKAAYEHALIDIEEAEASLTNAKYNVDKKFD